MNAIQDILEQMKNARELSTEGSEEAERAHAKADELLCELVRHLAASHEQRQELEEGLATYGNFHKWYA